MGIHDSLRHYCASGERRASGQVRQTQCWRPDSLGQRYKLGWSPFVGVSEYYQGNDVSLDRVYNDVKLKVDEPFSSPPPRMKRLEHLT